LVPASQRAPPLAPIYPLSLHDALPIYHSAAICPEHFRGGSLYCKRLAPRGAVLPAIPFPEGRRPARCRPQLRTRTVRRQIHQKRSEEHTSELQSRFDLVCRLLLEKKNT